jgi:hypothetical protein
MTDYKRAVTGVTSQNVNPVIVSDKYYAEENEFRYVIIHDTQQYVDKQKSAKIHPFSILLKEGFNNCESLWSRQRITIQNDIPDNFTEYIIDESEYNYE